jgi:threo-3-hydroxy-L-aspartate ammonia-lyase
MKSELKGKRVGIIVSGGNVDLARFGTLVGG